MMTVAYKFQLSAVAAGLFLVAGCAITGRTPLRRQQLISLLQHEMQTSAGWIQVHAADALLDHGDSASVAAVFAPMAENPPAAYRVGVWRVMARAAQTKEGRRAAVENIQKELRDPHSVDRLRAVESLAKLGMADPADRETIRSWLPNADEAAVPFLRWALALSETGEERAVNETALAALLDANDPVTRLRAAVALGRLGPLAPPVLQRLRAQIKREPAESIGKVYVIAANLRQAGGDAKLKDELIEALQPYLSHGEAGEQLEAGAVLGQCGGSSDRSELETMLRSPEADARIGAASGLLYLSK
jgi:HEAT repeat protein